MDARADDIHIADERRRHAALLEQARTGELAAKIAQSRRLERRLLLRAYFERARSLAATPSSP